MLLIKGKILVLFDDFIPPHEGEDGSAVLVEGGRLGLVEVGSQVLRIDRQYLISSDIEIGLQFLYLCEIGFVVPHIDLRHYLSVVVAKLCVNLDSFNFTCGLCYLKN